MPGTINGIGTSLCGGRGHVCWYTKGKYEWGRSATDFDALECFCVFFMPIIPYRALHAFNMTSAGTGYTYHRVPIKWSLALIVRTFLRRWLAVPCFVGGMLALIGVINWQNGRGVDDAPSMFISGSICLVIAFVGWWLLGGTDRRTRHMRYVLGPTQFGSSDPATWAREVLDQMSDPHALFGTTTFAAAAMQAISNEDWCTAMRAARLCAALEDVSSGERLTDEILNEPAVQEGIAVVQRTPTRWGELLSKPVPQPQGSTAAPASV
jgi:hypothetical protein